jgi:hypothetical protein
MVVGLGCVVLCHRRRPNRDVEVPDCHRTWKRVQFRRKVQGSNGIYRRLRSKAELGEVEQVESAHRGGFWICAGTR